MTDLMKLFERVTRDLDNARAKLKGTETGWARTIAAWRVEMLESTSMMLGAIHQSLPVQGENKRLWARVFATSYQQCESYDEAMATADAAVADCEERFP